MKRDSSNGARRLLIAALFSTVALPACQAAAQEQTDQRMASADIVVTAQRRSESLQDVPLAITSISVERAAQLNLRDLGNLQQVTPGLSFSSGINYVQTYIRGVGENFSNPGVEQPVATYIDGAYVERGFGSIYDIVDPASIQVLKGPQGTLWGRNATGGAVLINTADPESVFRGKVLTEVGNLDHQLAEGMINTPLSDTVAARVAVRYRHDGGYVRNLVDGFKFGERENWTVRGKLVFNPTSDFSAVAQVQYDHSKRGPAANAGLTNAPLCAFCGFSAYSFPRTDRYTTVGNVVNGGVGGLDKSTFLNLKMNYDLGSVSIGSTTAYRKTDNFESGDFDFTEIDGFNLAQFSGAKTFTQDFQLTTDFDGIFNVVSGVSYLKDTSYYKLAVPTANGFANLSFVDQYGIKSESYSAFAEGTLEPVSGLKLTAGGRYSHDKRIYSKTGADISFDRFTPRIVVAYDAGQVNVYASYNAGYKAGGFSGSAAVFRPETINSYEAGIKFVSSNRRLRANIAVYKYDLKNLQVTAIDQSNVGNIANVLNANSTGKGLEFDFDYAPVDQLQVFGGFSHIDAYYKSYKAAGVQVPVRNGNGQITGFAAGTEDLTGFRLPHAPRYSAFVGITVKTEISADWKADLTGFVRHSSGFDFYAGGGGPLRLDASPAVTTAKLNFRVMPTDERYEIGFYVDNLTNVAYPDFRFSTAPFGSQEVVARPRTYGLRIGANF